MTATEAPARLGRRLTWRAAEVRHIAEETPRVKSMYLHVPDWPGHLAGQHVDIRLTAEDGYQAQRSYSIASAPEQPGLTLTVEEVENGEVSSYLVGELRVGDKFEVRGPIGGYFVWTAALGGPLFLIAGGSGIVPLMAILRHRRAAASSVSARLLYSSRRYEDIIYRNELDAMARDGDGVRVTHTLTRVQPAGWAGNRRRIDKAMLSEAGFTPDEAPKIFVCGPTPLVEDVSRHLVELGHDPACIKTERFGPTGG